MTTLSLLGLVHVRDGKKPADALDEALSIYRERFQPSAQLSAVYAAPCVNVIVADADEDELVICMPIFHYQKCLRSSDLLADTGNNLP